MKSNREQKQVPKIQPAATAEKMPYSQKSMKEIKPAGRSSSGYDRSHPGIIIPSASYAQAGSPVIQQKSLGVFSRKEQAPAIGSTGDPIQLMRFKNTKTGFSFNISDNGKFINAVALTAPKSKKETLHHGSLRYSFKDKSLVIEHIENEPEEGSGLGPLLIYLAAKKTQELGLKVISVVGLRYPEYYARWGFDIETPREHTRKKYIEAGRKEDIPKVIAVPQADSTPDIIKSKTSPWVQKTWVDELAETHKTSKDKTKLTEFPRIE